MNEPADKIEVQYRLLFMNMPNSTSFHKILTDKKGNAVDYEFLEVNKAFEKLTGLGREEIIGKKATQLFPSIKDSTFNWIDFYGKISTTEKEITFEQYLKEQDCWCLVSVYSYKKGYFSIIYTDITKRRNAEDSLRKAYDSLKKTQSQLIQTEKMNVVGRLASGIAHEVKNPLSIILQGINYLSKKISTASKDINYVLQSMNEAVGRASNIINDLLDFSRLSRMEMQEECLNSVIENSLRLVKSDIETKDIKLVRDLGNIPKVGMDKNRIQQVCINILINAIQAMGKGGELKVRTFSEKRESKIFIIAEIEDTGSGIPPDIMDKIFDPFFTTKRDDKGTGLGLSIVRNIIELHNADIKVANRKDRKGVKVRLEFRQ